MEMKRGGQFTRERDQAGMAGMRAGLNDGGVLIVINFVGDSERKISICKSSKIAGLKSLCKENQQMKMH